MIWPLCAALILANALFVLMEYALVRSRPSRIELLARQGGRRAALVQDLLARMDDSMAACQVGISIVSLALGWVGEPAAAAAVRRLAGSAPEAFLGPRLFEAACLGLSLAALSWVQIVFGELVPRAVGLHKAETVALWGAAPLKLFSAALRPPVAFLSASSRAVLRLLGLGPAAEAQRPFSIEEMRVLLGETQEKGAMPLERLLLLENLFDFGSAKASDAMRPREKIAYLSLARSWEENLALIRREHYTRYPLCEYGLDFVLGYVNVKDLFLREDAAPPDLRALRRDLPEVADSEPLEKLVKAMPDRGQHMALVRDAAGRVAGLLTLEDILEEIVGEVHDEFERPNAWSAGEIFARAVVDANLPPEDRPQAIRRLLAKLKAAAPALEAEAAFAAVWERERKFASAVGRGVLVPHARLPGLASPLVAVGRFTRPPALPSPDDVPIRLVFLVLTPAETPVVQLNILQRIAALVSNETLRRRLWRAKTDEALLELLRTADTLLAS